ncbi:MAG: LamG-like jellyroll fold domain-containing protein [Pirellulaceae bacterium]
MDEKENRLDSLLLELENGSLSEVQRSELQALLRGDEVARKRYVQWQLFSAAMQLESASGGGTVSEGFEIASDLKNNSQPRRANGFSWKSLLSLAAGIAACVLIARWVYLELGDSSVYVTTVAQNEIEQRQTGSGTVDASHDIEATSRGIAMVTRLVDAKWNRDSSRPEVGTALTPGRVELDSGYAQIEFFCGATVVLEGPAEIELISATEAKFHRGRLRAAVPPAARGFRIDVDDMKVVDLGTEFGLDVSSSGANVQVFDGEVEVHQPNTDKQLIQAGQAVQRNDGALRKLAATPDRFVDLATLDTQARDQTAQRYQRWLKHSQALRRDPRLIAYYAMDETQQWSRKLLNRASLQQFKIAPSELDGAIVGANRVGGRWPSKDALEFKQPGDRVRVKIPGEFRSLTFAVWVKIDSLDRWYNSLFLTDNYQAGEPHWQILDTGQLFFSVRPGESKNEPEHREVVSAPFWDPSLSGKWLHLATVYDVDAKQTTHFLDGRLIHQEMIPDAQLVETTRIGMASIGNWSMPTKEDDHFAIRNLNGSLDELAIFQAALTPAEIVQMYESGKP